MIYNEHEIKYVVCKYMFIHFDVIFVSWRLMIEIKYKWSNKKNNKIKFEL